MLLNHIVTIVIPEGNIGQHLADVPHVDRLDPGVGAGAATTPGARWLPAHFLLTFLVLEANEI